MRRKRRKLQLFYNIVNKNTPNYLCTLIPPTMQITSVYPRYYFTFQLSHSSHAYSKSGLIYTRYSLSKLVRLRRYFNLRRITGGLETGTTSTGSRQDCYRSTYFHKTDFFLYRDKLGITIYETEEKETSTFL
jgi:hypothetical protein